MIVDGIECRAGDKILVLLDDKKLSLIKRILIRLGLSRNNDINGIYVVSSVLTNEEVI